jgi:hypothetical protein
MSDTLLEVASFEPFGSLKLQSSHKAVIRPKEIFWGTILHTLKKVKTLHPHVQHAALLIKNGPQVADNP